MVCHLVRGMKARQIATSVGCLDLVGELGEELRSEGVEVTNYHRKPGLDLGLPGRIARAVGAGDHDLVHAHQYTPFFYGALAKLRRRTPLIFTEHGRFYPDEPSSKRRLFNAVFGGRADRITAVSEGVRESLRRVEGLPAERIEVIYNGVDLSDFVTDRSARREIRKSIGLPPDVEVIGTVGRLDSIKNQSLLLRSVARMHGKDGGPHLVIVGDGEEGPRLEELARELGISERVTFLGERKDVNRLLTAFDVFALTSLSEGTPMTLLEAAATRLPIVSTAVGGIPEILRDGEEALLVDGPGDESTAEGLAGAFSRVLSDPELARSLGESAERRARRDFSLDAICDRYVEMYESVTVH